MSKKKFVMPSGPQFLEKKRIYDERPDPVWVTIERDMQEMAEKKIKPYNELVGTWLRYLKDLRYHFFRQSLRYAKKLREGVGPPWYYELSVSQREVLGKLKFNIHQDLLEDLPIRTRRALIDLGITLKIPKAVLMKAMKNSIEDPGVFIWDLYKALYKQSPNELRGSYDMNATILMSSLVFIDLEECVERLTELLRQDPPPKPKPKPQKKLYHEPKCRYGAYLQRLEIPLVSNYGDGTETKPKPPPLDYRLRLKSENSHERLCNDLGFLEKRRDRNKKAAQKERICNYKFWEAPCSLRNTDPKMAAYVEKLRMIKLKAKPRFKSQYANAQYLVSGVAFIKGRPQYILQSICLLPTGYIPINGGIINVNDQYVTNILGHWKFPKVIRPRCSSGCQCLATWEEIVMKYVEESKCKCGHLYDFYHTGVSKEKYYYPPSKNGPHWFDKAKIYELDPVEDFIKETVRTAVKSDATSSESSLPEVSVEGLDPKVLLKAFLSDLADTPLLIPHLPQAHLLNNLQEWVRQRVQGNLEPKQNAKLKLRAERNWLRLKHMDFRARAYRIPFTLKELEHMTWAQRHVIQDLFRQLLDDFVSRNRLKQVQQTRLWWPTMNFDAYPSESFLNVFFTYMPGRMIDTYLINPFSSSNTPSHGGKTCPLKF